jgi:hypothetical protein
MRLTIDAEREAADHDQSGTRQLVRELDGARTPVRAGTTGPHHRDGRWEEGGRVTREVEHRGAWI